MQAKNENNLVDNQRVIFIFRVIFQTKKSVQMFISKGFILGLFCG